MGRVPDGVRGESALEITVNAIAPGYLATENTAALQTDRTHSESIFTRLAAGQWGNRTI